MLVEGLPPEGPPAVRQQLSHTLTIGVLHLDSISKQDSNVILAAFPRHSRLSWCGHP